MKQLPRRTFLKGVGLSMGLPWLEAMQSQSLLAGPKQEGPPVRMAFVFFPNGAIMPAWKPATSGDRYEMSETLKILADHKANLNVITGLAQENGFAKGDGPGDHARCASTYLTGVHPYKTAGANIKVGVSVDQVAADRIGKRTRLASLELGIESGRNAGSCDSGYSCAYSNNISWKSATTPMAKEIHPRLVFERLFGSGKQEEAQKERDFYRKSILDLVAGDAAQLRKQLGQTDQRKLDEYFSSVRDLEQRIVRAEEAADRERPEVDIPDQVPRDPDQHIRLMYDLLVLAFRTDTTRVATFMLGNAGSNRSYRMVDVNEGHHHLSHHRNDSDKVEKIKRIDAYLCRQFKYFLDQMKAVPEGEGTLLDHSMIVYGSGLSDGNRHNHDDLPIVMAGGGGGTIKTGRHIDLGKEIPLNNLFLSMLDRLEAGVEKLGDSSGRLTQIDA